MTIRKRAHLALALLTVAGMLVGCGSSSLRVGWRAFDGPRRRRASYTSFSGVERASFRAQAGADVALEYEVEVEKGTLSLELKDPDGELLWEETLEDGAMDEVHVRAPEDGRYALRIEGDGPAEATTCRGPRGRIAAAIGRRGSAGPMPRGTSRGRRIEEVSWHRESC